MYRRFFARTLKAFSFGAAVFAALALTGVLFSCGNIGGDYSGAGLFPEIQAGGTEIGAKIGMARIMGTIDNQIGVSKSVVPTESDVKSGISRYVVYAWGTKSDGTAVPESSPIEGTVSSDNKTFGIDLPYGTWTVRADGLNSSDKVILRKTTESDVVLSSDRPVANLAFALDYAKISGQKGSMSVSVTCSATNICTIQYTLTDSDGVQVVDGLETNYTGITGTFVFDSALESAFGNLEPDDYKFVVEFKAADGSVLMRMDQIVQIYSNLTTNKIDGVAPYLSGGAIEISETLIKKYQQSVVYVGGTGIGPEGKAASDLNNGTQFDPVEHIDRAVDIINNSILSTADVPDGFKIFVQADTSLAGNFSLSSAKKITVIGTNQSALYKISGADAGNPTYSISSSADDITFSYINIDKLHGFEVTAGQVSLSDCKITNGSAPSTYEGGGGICVDGPAKVVLKNCSITGCSCDYFGGAIYANDESGVGIAEVQLTNCVIGSDAAASCATTTAHSNMANNGGGIYLKSNGKVTLSDTKILYNCANVAGGGICCYGGTLEITGGQINYNYSGEDGGGIFVEALGASAAPSVTINGCAIGMEEADAAATGISDCGNYSNSQGGGGISFLDGTLATTTGFKVIKNYSAGTLNGGGGIYAGHALTLEGCQINYNFAETAGGGIYNSAGADVTFKSGTINGNRSVEKEGAAVYAGGDFVINGGTISANSTVTDNGSAIFVAFGSNFEISAGSIESNNVRAINNAGTTTISGTAEIKSNTTPYHGAGVYCEGSTSATLIMTGGTISGNSATANNGGGVYIASDDSGHNATFKMSDGTISGNSTGDLGGGVCNSGAFEWTGGTISENTAAKTSAAATSGGGAVASWGTFVMGGGACAPAGDDGSNGVYIHSGKIELASSLTSAAAPVAVITPRTYSSGDTVIGLASPSTVTNIAAELAKFAVAEDPSGEAWSIAKKDSADEGVLATANIYVDGSAASEGAGTKVAPCKTVANALTKVMAPNCNIILLGDTTETESLSITTAMEGLTIKSDTTEQRTVTASGNKQLVGEGNFSATKITFDHYSVRIFAAGSDTERTELNDVEIINADQANAGGGLNVSGGSVVSATNLKITSCQAQSGGGGINVSASGKFTADGITISGCNTGPSTVAKGGGICNYGSVSLRQAKISGCSAGGVGDGIYNGINGELTLNNETNIDSEIYLADNRNPINVNVYFELASGAGKIPVGVDMDLSVSYPYSEGDVVVNRAGGVTEAQCKMFEMPGSKYSIEYDGAATPPCGKLVDKSIAGGVTVNLGANILFEIGTPSASGEKARFNVIDNSSGTPTYVTPTSAQIKILQYGSPVYSAAAQEVTATYLPEGQYELYCKAVVGGVTYDTTLPFDVVSVPAGFVVVEGSTVVGGDKFKDEYIKAGVFVAGRSVTISTFWICDHEVTQAEYQAVMGTNPSYFDGSAGGKATPSGETQENRPVETVSWYDALVYCNKKSIAEGLEPCYTINGKTDPDEWGDVPTSSGTTWDAATCDFTKSGYRLPTEAEWEYAARGGKAGCEAANPTDYAGTDSSSELGKYAWYTSNSGSKTHEVKKDKQTSVNSANSLGLYDMSGNVFEWCWDWYDSITTATPASGASSGSYRVCRGGSWNKVASYCSVAYRDSFSPYYRNGNLGFRVVRAAP